MKKHQREYKITITTPVWLDWIDPIALPLFAWYIMIKKVFYKIFKNY